MEINVEKIKLMKHSDILREMQRNNMDKMTITDNELRITIDKNGYKVCPDKKTNQSYPKVNFNLHSKEAGYKKEIDFSDYGIDDIGEINWKKYDIDKVE